MRGTGRSFRDHRITRAIVLLAGAAGILATLAQQAPAAIVGLTQSSQTSVENSSNKAITATCPAGMKVLSAGADVTPGGGQVVIDALTPAGDLRSVKARAHEDDTGTADSWFVAAYATCAYPPAGLERVMAATPSNSSSKGIVAKCPAGKKLFGVGAEFDVTTGNVLIDNLTPNAELTSVTAHAVEDEDGTAANWSLRAYAICATPIVGMERVKAVGVAGPGVSQVMNVQCPNGKGLLGGGGETVGAKNQIVLDAVFPDVPVTTAGFAAWEDETGTGKPWYLTVYGICAPRVGLLKSTAEPAADPRFGALTGPLCPEGQESYGAGYRLLGAFGQVWPTHIIPFYNDDILFGAEDPGSFVLAYPDANGTGPWTLEAQSVCATPLAGHQGAFELHSQEDAPARQTVSATCPLGKNVVGGGGRAIENISSPPNRRGESMIDAFAPDSTLTSVDVRVIPAPVPQFTGTVTTQAVAHCATSPPGLELVTGVSFNSSIDKVRQAACPAAKHVIGSGAQIVNGFGRVVLDRVDIKPDLSSVTASGSEVEGGTSGNWSLRVYAICINR
jgi:hypothetical protein